MSRNRVRNPRFAPEFLERRLSPSSVTVSSAYYSTTTTTTTTNPNEPPPGDTAGSPPAVPPTYATGIYGPA